MYFVLEGQDATGKDTLVAMLAEHLAKKGQPVVSYAESGTGSDREFIKSIAKLNYGEKQNLDPRTHVLLFLINRLEQWRKLAEPALRRGDHVILSRNWLSTLIYEGYGTGVSRTLIARLHKLILPAHYFLPDRIVILTLDDATRAKRLAARSDGARNQEFFKSKPDSFQQKVNHAYLKIAKDHHIPTLDTSGTIEESFVKLCALWGV